MDKETWGPDDLLPFWGAGVTPSARFPERGRAGEACADSTGSWHSPGSATYEHLAKVADFSVTAVSPLKWS